MFEAKILKKLSNRGWVEKKKCCLEKIWVYYLMRWIGDSDMRKNILLDIVFFLKKLRITETNNLKLRL